jgi:hypothetical protein
VSCHQVGGVLVIQAETELEGCPYPARLVVGLGVVLVLGRGAAGEIEPDVFDCRVDLADVFVDG